MNNTSFEQQLVSAADTPMHFILNTTTYNTPTIRSTKRLSISSKIKEKKRKRLRKRSNLPASVFYALTTNNNHRDNMIFSSDDDDSTDDKRIKDDIITSSDDDESHSMDSYHRRRLHAYRTELNSKNVFQHTIQSDLNVDDDEQSLQVMIDKQPSIDEDISHTKTLTLTQVISHKIVSNIIPIFSGGYSHQSTIKDISANITDNENGGSSSSDGDSFIIINENIDTDDDKLASVSNVRDKKRRKRSHHSSFDVLSSTMSIRSRHTNPYLSINNRLSSVQRKIHIKRMQKINKIKMKEICDEKYTFCLWLTDMFQMRHLYFSLILFVMDELTNMAITIYWGQFAYKEEFGHEADVSKNINVGMVFLFSFGVILFYRIVSAVVIYQRTGSVYKLCFVCMLYVICMFVCCVLCVVCMFVEA